MGKARWVGVHQQRLYWWSLAKLAEQYPDYSKDTLKGKKYPLIKKVKEGKIPMPEKPPESNEQHEGQLPQEGILDSTWEMMHKNNDGEAEITTLHKYVYNRGGEDTWRAEPAKITPSRARPKKVGIKEDIFVFGDEQIGFRNVLNRDTGKYEHVPMHDKRKMRVARMIAKDIAPTLLVNLGDKIDLSDLSKYEPDSNHFDSGTFEHSCQEVHDDYAGYRSDHPKARIVEVPSNHNDRFNQQVLKRWPHAYNVRRASSDSKYPAFSYPYMANLEHVGVEYIDGYPVGELIIPRGDKAPLRFAHNTETSSASSSAASKVMKNHPETFNFGGHDHKDSEAWHTLRSGEQVGSFVFGALANATGLVPGFRSAVTASGEPVFYQQNWTSSVGRIILYENDEVEVHRIMINHDGTAYYNGKLYEA